MKFDLDAAHQERIDNPGLSIFDSGEMLEPKLTPGSPGQVDFETDTPFNLTVMAYPSSVEDDTVVLEIDSNLLSKLRIIVNDGDVARIDFDGTPTYGERDDS
jgi:hypothetical protein